MQQNESDESCTLPTNRNVKTVDNRTKTKIKYFKPYPEIQHIKNNKPKKATKKFLLRNGNLLQPLKVNGITYQIKNTCLFDSIATIVAQIVLLIALEDENYFNYISNSTNRFLKFCQSILKTGVNISVYKERIALTNDYILNSGLSETEDIGVRTIDTYGNVSTIWTSLTKDQPCANIISECSSLGCQKEIRPVHVFDVNHHTIQRKGFAYIEEAINYNFFVRSIKCQHSECTGRRTDYAEVKSHVYIELDIKVSSAEQTGMRCKLNAISSTINILKQEYR